ncbi:MAG TPA: hypothetical protein DIT33_01915 [Pseudomonas sp.]|jgi:hypothetical protein|uniref:Lipoprotein n=1 Tax=Pseudomonas helleri TaxID=1608996 RepID=A0A6A7ZBP8_9PSED|nr:MULTISPECIES: hypothetical protein [Pseudomonas]KMN19303.1 hypothetical protein TU85_23895 [Pseudomonas helleri]MQT36479.1 hypothetical protein [Pseudomonas helleri]MQT43170.1 hypothetical protein [Pseudomonas sp. FSL R10-0765]MQT53910.1 hypothetical protein [Pseudomonas sp. FSL R10-2398]MQT76332.1 hypothetical protein [Pseudomonas helleri]
MSTRSTLCLLLLPMFAGCQYLPHTDYFVAPANEPNPAWIRVVNFTQHAAIYQSANGVKTGGVVRTGPLPFIHTQDIGMPKAGQNLTWDYYESTLRPGLETSVYMSWEGTRTRTCFVTTTFTPEAGRYYQFLLTSGDGGTCTLYPTLIERDKDSTGWHLVPNKDVTYKYDGPTAKSFYTNSQFEDPNYQPPPERYPGIDVR